LLAAALVLVAIVALALLLLLTDTALSVWERLAAAPAWVRFGWLAGVGAVTVGATLLAWRWLRPRPEAADAIPEPTLDPEQLQEELALSEAHGINVEDALAELAERERRREGGEVYLAVFGEVSAGKSALVRALVPGADAPSDPRAGTTTEIRHHHWNSERGDRIVIADLPGFNLGEDERLMEEARRAHEVIFLADGDLTASQFSELDRLLGLNKPVLLALNKIDRYSEEEQRALRARLAEQTGLAPERIIAIRSGGREEIVRLLSDGSEARATRERDADVEPLRKAVQEDLDRNAELMETLQDTSVLLLAAEKLDLARKAHRSEQADALVSTYSRRAVIGALAAVAPGSDLVIQGVLATRLIQELCALYDVSVKDVEIESFLKLAGGRVRKMSALTLAIGGNALKAFPGIGTLTGGLLHAVAYGMIFDSLGRAASDTLASRGDLRALPAARAFEENLTDALENHAGRFARMALREARNLDAS
jgi:GTP-binding protein EngB required for normal cell division